MVIFYNPSMVLQIVIIASISAISVNQDKIVKPVQAKVPATTRLLFNYACNDIQPSAPLESPYSHESLILKSGERGEKKCTKTDFIKNLLEQNPTHTPPGAERANVLIRLPPCLCVRTLDYRILICTGRSSQRIQNSILCLHIDIRLARFNHDGKQ